MLVSFKVGIRRQASVRYVTVFIHYVKSVGNKIINRSIVAHCYSKDVSVFNFRKIKGIKEVGVLRKLRKSVLTFF